MKKFIFLLLFCVIVAVSFIINCGGPIEIEGFTTTISRSELPDGILTIGELIYTDEESLNNYLENNQGLFPTQAEIFDTWGFFYEDAFWTDRQEASYQALVSNHPAKAWSLDDNGTPADDSDDFITYPLNANPSGFVSPEKYSAYSFETTLFSTAGDDDIIGVVAAFVREGDDNYLLTLIRSGDYVATTSGDLGIPDGWGLAAYRLKSGNLQDFLYAYSVPFDPDGFGNGAWGDGVDLDTAGSAGYSSRIKVERDRNTFTITATPRTASRTATPPIFSDSDYSQQSVISIDLDAGTVAALNSPDLSPTEIGDISELERFKLDSNGIGHPYGLFVNSQAFVLWQHSNLNVIASDTATPGLVLFMNENTLRIEIWLWEPTAGNGAGDWVKFTDSVNQYFNSLPIIIANTGEDRKLATSDDGEYYYVMENGITLRIVD